LAVTDVVRNLVRILHHHGVSAVLLVLRGTLFRGTRRLYLFGLTEQAARLLPSVERLESRLVDRAEAEALRERGHLRPDCLERLAWGDR